MRLPIISGMAIVLLLSTPALAAHTQNAVLYDPVTGIQEVYVPDDDSQLDDLSPPPGQVKMLISVSDYAALNSDTLRYFVGAYEAVRTGGAVPAWGMAAVVQSDDMGM